MVRPDALAVDFALRTVVDDPDVGVRILAEATKALEGRFAEVVPRGSLSLRMRAMNIEPAPHASGKVTLARDVCAPAAQVVARLVSFEEIELTLPIECRRLE